MRLKGISWIEQHFEKVFAGIFGVAALGVLVWQFAGKPNTVSVGTKKDIPLDAADSELIAAARRTKSSIQQTEVEVPVLPEGGNPIALFEKNYKGPVSPSAELALGTGRTGDAIGVPTPRIDRVNAPLAQLVVPPTTRPVARSRMSTIHPSEAEVPEIAAVLPQNPPFDKASVSIEAAFDGRKFKAALETDPDGPAGPIQPIRRDWWEPMQILGYEVEREELLADGTWGKLARVPAVPGRFSLLPDLAAGVPNMDELVRLRTEATEFASEIRRPEFYQVWIGDEWQSPMDELLSSDADRSAGGEAQKLAQKKSLERRLETLREKRAEMGPMTGRPPGSAGRDEPPPQERGGGGGGRKRGGAGAGGGGGRSGQPADRTFTDGQRAALDQQIAALEKQIAQLSTELGLAPAPAQPADDARAPRDGQPKQPPIFDLDDLRLWTHDFNVERGRTYRYRATLVLNNPLFGKGSVMVPEQAEWARATLVRSAPSEWSEPVEVPREKYWFIVGANEPGSQLARSAEARAEVFVFTLGYWRRGSASLEPGDRVAADVPVPDVSKLASATPEALPGQVPVPSRDDGAGGARSGKGNRRSAGAETGPPTGGESPANAVAATPPPMINRPVPVEATLLGVGSVSLADEAQPGRRLTQAYLRLDDGSVRSVRPDLERSHRTYRDVSASAERARLASQPREAERTRPDRPGPRETPNPGGASPPPGGSGGG